MADLVEENAVCKDLVCIDVCHTKIQTMQFEECSITYNLRFALHSVFHGGINAQAACIVLFHSRYEFHAERVFANENNFFGVCDRSTNYSKLPYCLSSALMPPIHFLFFANEVWLLHLVRL